MALHTEGGNKCNLFPCSVIMR